MNFEEWFKKNIGKQNEDNLYEFSELKDCWQAAQEAALKEDELIENWNEQAILEGKIEGRKKLAKAALKLLDEHWNETDGIYLIKFRSWLEKEARK